MIVLKTAANMRCAGGIGPTDQLTVVQGSSDGATMIDESDWIDLPVGYNLAEQMNVSTLFPGSNWHAVLRC